MAANHSNPIEHVIVLMLENRSYDNMLGFLPGPGALTGSEFNLADPNNPASEKAQVNAAADFITEIDPLHDFDNVQLQLFGSVKPPNRPAEMNGFVKSMTAAAKGNLAVGRQIMQCFDPQKLPVLTSLAQEFCLCTRWFASIPGPTWPNRTYIHAATSDGMIANDVLHDYDMKTIYDSLEEKGLSWAVYYNDIPQSLFFEHNLNDLDNFKHFSSFSADLKTGRLPAYSFIEPRYLNLFEWKANDMHPPHDVRLGEYFIAEIYETLRRSALWEKSLLVVLFDEHGGFYDHVPPPSGAPNPDGKVALNPAFDFTRLGLRVPAILVSPWIEKGRVDETVYEHSSLLATVKKLFNLPHFLTARDRAANTFEHNLNRAGARTDAPIKLPIAGAATEAAAHRRLMRTNPADKIRQGNVSLAQASAAPLSSYQQELVDLARRVSALPPPQGRAALAPVSFAPPETEHDAALQVQVNLASLLRR